MSLPLIGLTVGRMRGEKRSSGKEGDPSRLVLPEAYTTAVQRAGGLPVMISFSLSRGEVDELISRLQGLMLTGGGDIDPEWFGGRPHRCVRYVDSGRDEVEISLIRRAVEFRLPLLCICRGIQVLNVAFGGTLYTDIEDQLPGSIRHDWDKDFPRDHLAHTVSVESDSRLAGILGDGNVGVNSWHHQGLEKVAENLRPVAYAPDGLVEAVEMVDYPFGLGVQWHPEFLPDLPEMQVVFRSFIQAAGG